MNENIIPPKKSWITKQTIAYSIPLISVEVSILFYSILYIPYDINVGEHFTKNHPLHRHHRHR